MARRNKSLYQNKTEDEIIGYRHREHRSKRALKGKGGTYHRQQRLMRQGIQFKEAKWRPDPNYAIIQLMDIQPQKEYKDIDSKCIEPGCEHPDYTFTIGEQKYFDKMGFTYPKRCIPCRKKKSQQMNSIKNRNA